MTPHLYIDGHRQHQLFERLVCPLCRGGLIRSSELTTGSVVVSCSLDCLRCGTVGVTRNGRPSFLERDLTSDRRLDEVQVELPWTARDSSRDGRWHRSHEGEIALDLGSGASGTFEGTGLEFDVLAHSWSGECRFSVDDQHQVLDLSSSEAKPRTIAFSGFPLERHSWSVRVVAPGNAGMRATQLVLRSIRATTSAVDVEPVQPLPVNRGNPYPPALDDLLADLPEDAFVLDLGGGDRRHPDPRVFNLEYLPYTAVDIYGDGLALPFASSSVDAILSQAVLEHVPDPQVAVDEMARVLRGSGTLYAEFAFMQPLHAVPHHFFNITTHGAAKLFAGFQDVRIATFGGLSVTLDWIFSLVDARARVGDERVAQVLAVLELLDETLDDRDLEHVASAVSVHARAPEQPPQ